MVLLNKDSICEKASKIKLILLDVDGTLTDGQLILGEKGEHYKSFNIKDGMGIHLIQKEGVKVGIVSGRRSKVVEKRAEELEIMYVWQGVEDKGDFLKEILKRFDLKPEEVAFIGDDLNDLSLLKIVGLSAAVGDAVQEIKEVVDYITEKKGGEGAVREFIDLIRAKKVLGV